MNYPVWDLSVGAGLLIAIVAILHVFVSHFAVGSGLFLVVTERKARRDNDPALLGWVKKHTKFFVLVSVVFGAISGVGIWFTIGLISPQATSNLIHIYVWGWAIEWVFFFLEITAGLLYLYGWDKLEPKLHMWFGWVYFWNAWLSLVVINGIITFMLTSGNWGKDQQFWTGFFNPTYFPSLLFRTAIALALAGVYALITASVLKDTALKARIVRWAAAWTIPALIVLPAIGWWYIKRIPADIWANARGPMPTATTYAGLAVLLIGAALLLALVTVLMPKRMNLAVSLLLLLISLGAMGSFEMVRESLRKPYVISNYLYSNSLYSATLPGDGGFSEDEVSANGALKSAHWVVNKEITPANELDAGHEVFRVECQSCHTQNAYRGIRKLIAQRQWDEAKIEAMTGGLNFMHNGVMPAFAGTDQERVALAKYLSSLEPITTEATNASVDGATVFARNCAMCHQVTPADPLFTNLVRDPAAAADALQSLPALFPVMPDLKLTAQQRAAVVQWINAQRGPGGPAYSAQAANTEGAK